MVRMQEAQTTSGMGRTLAMGAAIVGVSLVLVAIVSSYGAIVAVFDGVAALAIMVPALLFGISLVEVTRFRKVTLRWRVLLGCAIGLGLLSLLTLLMGLAGFLGRSLWVGLLIAMFVVGVLGSRHCLDKGERDEVGDSDFLESSRYRLLWWAVVPFVTLALLAAAHPPGFLWAEEGFGYDVLEYHLEVPREFVDAGVISYLPHNVYGSFPAATEMLYMVAMIVHGKVQEAGTIANMIHFFFGVLAVFAAWVTGREWSRAAGTVAAVSVASAGWLFYLSGLAYVENALLFFGLTATGCFLRALRVDGQRCEGEPGAMGWMLASGFCAGCACACKYTGVVFVLVPLLASALLFVRATLGRRLRVCIVFCFSAMIPFAPWLIKNQVWTGNPVFPLANSVFEGSPGGWGPEETAAWDQGHSLKEADRSLGRRLSLAWSHTFGDAAQRLGPVVLLVGLLGLVGRSRGRVDAALLMFLALQVLIWIFATHLFARFAVVFLIPLSLMLARSVCGASARRVGAICAIVAAGATWNAVFAVRLYASETAGPAPASLIYDSELPGFEYVGFVNDKLPPDAKVLFLGEAKAFYFKRPVGYCVTFNRNPFLAKLIGDDDGQDAREWFLDEGYTHLLVHYGELGRLSQTYGTSPPLSKEAYASLPQTLRTAGFRLVRDFAHPRGSALESYVAIYELAR